MCISARKDIIEEIKKMELNCIVDPTWLIKKDPLLSIAKTLFDNPIEISRDIIKKVGMTLDTETQNEFLRIYSIIDNIRGAYTYKTLILKCKLYRISADAYKRIKNNKVIQILCKS